MEEYRIAGNLTSWTQQQINTIKSTDINISGLLKDLGSLVGKSLEKYTKIASIEHYEELKVTADIKSSDIVVSEKENPGNEYDAKAEPTELKFFSYETLKKQAEFNKNNKIYRGKLYGTIETFDCATMEKCPICLGNGICSKCDGDRQIVCNVCEGTLKCPQCDGTGQYTCPDCEGDGDCPECGGDGEVDCPDCDGSGNYIDTYCNRCGGSGYYRNNIECKVCGGTGRYVVECKNCNGSGNVDCEDCSGSGYCGRCHGDGGWDCRACHASGKCGKCKAKGKIWCPDCHGKGKCFDCKGRKEITCRRCNGSGLFQQYKEYSFKEKSIRKYYVSDDILENADPEKIAGTVIYEGLVYEFLANQARVFDISKAEEAINGSHYLEWFRDALNINNEIDESKEGLYFKEFINCEKIPITKLNLRCSDFDFCFWIVGNDNIVIYDKTPGFFLKLKGFFA